MFKGQAADQAATDAVNPNVALAAAQATVASRQNSLIQVQAERAAADDGDAANTTAIELVWDNAVAQATQALSNARDAEVQAQAAADAANAALSIAQSNATIASQAAAEAGAQAATAASDASFAASFEYGRAYSEMSRMRCTVPLPWVDTSPTTRPRR